MKAGTNLKLLLRICCCGFYLSLQPDGVLREFYLSYAASVVPLALPLRQRIQALCQMPSGFCIESAV
jgi:hypothetical protein